MDIKTTLKTSVAVGALLALAAPMATAEAGGIKNQNGKMDLTVGGQIVRGLLYADNGEHSQLFQIDGVTTGSRIRFLSSGQLTESITMGGAFEFDISQTNDSATSALGDNGETAGGATTIGSRLADISFKHKSMGTLSMGMGNAASNGRSEVNLSGVGEWGVPASIGGNFLFFNDTTKALSAVSVGGVASNFDGQSRTVRVRYDLPTFAGISTAVSFMDDGASDIGMGYSAKFGSVAARLGAQYSNEKGASDTSTWSVSGAALHDSGLNARFLYGRRINGGSNAGGGNNQNNVGTNPSIWTVGLGYKAKLTALGGTNFAIDYSEGDDQVTQGNNLEALNLGVRQELSSVGANIGLSYHRYSFSDVTANNYNDIDTIYLQTQLTF